MAYPKENDKNKPRLISADTDKTLSIGAVFTPIKWAEFAIETFGLFQKWMDGARIFDPTMGEGNLIEAFVTYGISKGYQLSELPVHRLFGNELNQAFYERGVSKFREKYDLEMQANFTNEDLLKLQPKAYDILFGNPPWQNFVDLPDTYKAQAKRYFHKYDLVGNKQDLLLGGSRTDIAALIIQIAMKNFLGTKGEAVFFLPLSLFFNEAANKGFRKYSLGDTPFKLNCLFDFHKLKAFGGVATRYGLGQFIRDKQTVFPVPCFRNENGSWKEYMATALFHSTDSLSLIPADKVQSFGPIKPIAIQKESVPRQGINSCGANDIYFFDSLIAENESFVKLSNKTRKEIILPTKFIHPLITANDFKTEKPSPSKWVLIPYHSNGKPLKWEEIECYPELKTYLEKYQQKLENRKGLMLKGVIKRGFWWAMLGVGAYSFFPFKIVWEAYGRNSFRPKIFEGQWQANQSLQAFIPVKRQEEALRILSELSDKQIEDYLLSLKAEGTMNWAQTGKIKKFLRIEDSE